MGDFYDELLDMVPRSLRSRSGRVIHSGREAFTAPRPLYVLAFNPGEPHKGEGETIEASIEKARKQTQPWSVYAEGYPLVTRKPFHERVRHLLTSLDCDPCTVPASNIVFVRSRSESDLALEKDVLLRACWPFHAAVIKQLQVRVVLCMGGTAGKWVRTQLGATEEVETVKETNARKWRSRVHKTNDGLQVVTLTHPSRADWTAPATDPSKLVRRVLASASRG